MVWGPNELRGAMARLWEKLSGWLVGMAIFITKTCISILEMKEQENSSQQSVETESEHKLF